jgi:hypothetical protein
LRRRLILATATATAFAVIAAPAVAAEKTIWLDTHGKKKNARHLGPVSSKNPLTRGKPFVVTVRGTWSYLDLRREQLCGVAEARPLFPTPVRGVKNRRVIADSEFYFAQRITDCVDPLKVVQQGVRFQIATRRAFEKVLPIGSPLVAPSANHEYHYAVTGSARKIRFRIARESFLLDNYGRLRIRVRPATEADCTALGAGVFGFADVPACVAATKLRETVLKPKRRGDANRRPAARQRG